MKEGKQSERQGAPSKRRIPKQNPIIEIKHVIFGSFSIVQGVGEDFSTNYRLPSLKKNKIVTSICATFTSNFKG